jgi:hypothetical protein
MILAKCLIQGLSLLAICSSPAWGSEKVTLKNGKVFTVDTSSNGMPMAAKSDKTSGVVIAPIVAPAKQMTLSKPIHGKVAILWMFTGNLTATGNYKVAVSSPVDESISGSFDAKGPGKFYFQGLERGESPAAWAWIEEPGDSWIALTLTFTDESSKQSFQLTQWHRFGSNQKAAVKSMIRKLEAE